MKKFLLAIAAIVTCLNANAVIDEKFGTAEGSLSYSFGTATLKSTTYTTITFSLDNKDKATGMQLYFDYADKTQIASVKAATALTSQTTEVDLDDVQNFTFTFTKTSNEPSGVSEDASYATAMVSWNLNAGKTVTAIKSGDICVMYLKPGATGTLKVLGLVDKGDSKSLNLNDMSINLEEATGINGIADNAESASVKKCVKDGKVVIVKNGKEFSAAGAQMK